MKFKNVFRNWVVNSLRADMLHLNECLIKRCDENNRQLKEVLVKVSTFDDTFIPWSCNVETRIAWTVERLEHLKTSEELKRDVETLNNRYTAVCNQVTAVYKLLEEATKRMILDTPKTPKYTTKPRKR